MKIRANPPATTANGRQRPRRCLVSWSLDRLNRSGSMDPSHPIPCQRSRTRRTRPPQLDAAGVSAKKPGNPLLRERGLGRTKVSHDVGSRHWVGLSTHEGNDRRGRAELRHEVELIGCRTAAGVDLGGQPPDPAFEGSTLSFELIDSAPEQRCNDFGDGRRRCPLPPGGGHGSTSLGRAPGQITNLVAGCGITVRAPASGQEEADLAVECTHLD